MIVDSHCHLDRLDFDKLGLSLEQVLANARQKQVEHFLCVSVTLEQFPDMLRKSASSTMFRRLVAFILWIRKTN